MKYIAPKILVYGGFALLAAGVWYRSQSDWPAPSMPRAPFEQSAVAQAVPVVVLNGQTYQLGRCVYDGSMVIHTTDFKVYFCPPTSTKGATYTQAAVLTVLGPCSSDRVFISTFN